jgi:hypothetical protein
MGVVGNVMVDDLTEKKHTGWMLFAPDIFIDLR